MKKIIISLLIACSMLSVPVLVKADADVDAQFTVVQNLKNDIVALISQLTAKLVSLQIEIDNLHTLVNSKLTGGGSGSSLTDGLDHYYALTSNSNDSVGTNYGTDTNISHSSSGALFGSSSKIALASAIIMPTNLTVSALINYNYTGGTQPIFGDSNATITSFWYFFVTGNHLSMIYETPAGSRGYETTAELITNGSHCVSVTQIGTDAPVFYLDGSVINSVAGETQGSNGKPTAQGSAIGELGAANFLHWNSTIKNLGIWSRALSASEETQYNSNGCGI